MFMQWGWTPLHKAAECGSRPIVELLLDKGGNVEVVNKVWCCCALVSQLVESFVCI